jgi:small subunit ribosomal protein S20
MPNIQSAKKELRKMKKRAALNKVRRDTYKTLLKKAVTTKSTEMVQAAQQALDKAARTGVIKKNTAARKLSRLMKKINKK